MAKNSSLKLSLLVIGIVAVVMIRFFPSLDLPTSNFSTVATAIESVTPPPLIQARSGIPVHIKIPSINIDTAIEQVGIAPDGTMDVPKMPENTAWFDLGPRPGELGSAVIDGHSGYKDNKPAVFDNLNKLQKGDKIYVEDEFGVTNTFVVRELRSYDPKADASTIFGSNDNGIHLNLITCSGTWNETERTHSDRLVVFADKE